jgi:hypothetical protein
MQGVALISALAIWRSRVKEAIQLPKKGSSLQSLRCGYSALCSKKAGLPYL